MSESVVPGGGGREDEGMHKPFPPYSIWQFTRATPFLVPRPLMGGGSKKARPLPPWRQAVPSCTPRLVVWV